MKNFSINQNSTTLYPVINTCKETSIISPSDVLKYFKNLRQGLILFLFLFTGLLLSGFVQGQTVPLKGGEKVGKLTKDEDYKNPGWKKYYITLENNTGHNMWDVRLALSMSDAKILSCRVFTDNKEIGDDYPEENASHVTFTEPILPGKRIEIKIRVDKDKTPMNVKIIPTDSLGADLLLNNNINSGTMDKPVPTTLAGGKKTITFTPSYFPSLDYINNTGQEICDLRINNVLKADQSKVKIDSVFINGVLVSTNNIPVDSIHVYFPESVKNGEAYKVTVKFHDEKKAVTYTVIPTNKDSADIIYHQVTIGPDGMNDPKNGKTTVFYDDKPANNKVPSARPSITYTNKTNQTIFDLWTAIPKGTGPNNPKIVKVIVNGEEWPVDPAAKTDTIVHLLGPAGKEIKKDTTFTVTVILENGTVTQMTVTPTDSLHNIVTNPKVTGGSSEHAFDNRLGNFGLMGRSASMTAINESCSPISQLTFSSPDPGIFVVNAMSSLPSFYDAGNKILYFTTPVLQGEQLDIQYVLNQLNPYVASDSFPYTRIYITGTSSIPFDCYLTQKATTCETALDGGIDLVITEGMPPYWFLWSNGATTEDLSNTGTGTYTVTVSCLSGCMTRTCEVTAAEPFLDVIPIDTWCSNSLDGEAIALFAGLTEPVNYLWSNGSTLKHITGLTPGTYSVTVNDLSGCMLSGIALIQQPPVFLVTGNVSHAACSGSQTGAIDLSTINGAGVYSYKWNSGNTSGDRSALAAGIYTVTVTDGYGCKASASFPVGQPPAISVSMTKVSVKCGGKSTGKLTATITGGTPGYLFLWSNGSTAYQATGLVAGTYTVTVTDAAGCTKTKSTVLNENPPLLATVSQMPPVQATVNPAGGVPPYTFSWNTVPVQVTQTATGLIPGQSYKVTVKDYLNCSKSVTFIMNAQKMGEAGSDESHFIVSVSPNPTSGVSSITCSHYDSELFEVSLCDITGRLVYYKLIRSDTGEMVLDFNNQAKGIYVLRIRNDKKQIVQKLVIE